MSKQLQPIDAKALSPKGKQIVLNENRDEEKGEASISKNESQ